MGETVTNKLNWKSDDELEAQVRAEFSLIYNWTKDSKNVNPEILKDIKKDLNDVKMWHRQYVESKPKNKEAAVIMLADTVEAAARSEKNITVTKLQKILKESVERKFTDGQLDDCPVNRHDLELVKTAFLSILTGVFHPRIEYDTINSKNTPIPRNKK